MGVLPSVWELDIFGTGCIARIENNQIEIFMTSVIEYGAGVVEGFDFALWNYFPGFEQIEEIVRRRVFAGHIAVAG